jgi:membrane protease YdiL (CAAX protease family)
MTSVSSRKIIYFYLVAVGISWPLFFLTDFWLMRKYTHEQFAVLIVLYGHMAAMMGPMIAGMIALKYIEKTRLLPLAWGYKKYYSRTIYAILIIWIIPALTFLLFASGARIKSIYSDFDVIFIASYLIFGWVAGVGEEYGWSGYILTELSEGIGKTRAVAVSGTLRGLWHLPILMIPVMLKVGAGEQSMTGLFLLMVLFMVQLVISNIFMSALWGYVWFKTKSIPLLGWMHFMFDFGRDLSSFVILGFGSSIWFKFGWGIPFLFLAFLAFQSIARSEGYSSYLAIFRRKSFCT